MKKQVILCVDDESIVLKSLEMQLRKMYGQTYILEFAENAIDALDILEELLEERADIRLIISDWQMPGMKGDELLLKIHKKSPQIKKVLLTGQADEMAMSRVKQIPGTVLHKPWTEEDIRNLLT
jgi:DNA-binding NtrC family response regulator